MGEKVALHDAGAGYGGLLGHARSRKRRPRGSSPAQRSLFTSESDLAQSEATIASNLVALCKALGGGWEVSPGGGAAGAPAPSVGHGAGRASLTR